jgi:hypothetical protein
MNDREKGDTTMATTKKMSGLQRQIRETTRAQYQGRYQDVAAERKLNREWFRAHGIK